MRGVGAMALVLAASFGWASLGLAQDSSARDDPLEIARRARQLSGEIMSPFCKQRTMADCPSPAAAAVRDQIRVWLDSGLSEQDIKNRLERELGGMMPQGYSKTLASVPEGPSSWLVPILVLLAGAAVLVTVLVRLQRRPSAPAVSEQALRKVEAELDARLGEQGK